MKLDGGGDRVLANPFVPVNSLKKRGGFSCCLFSKKRKSSDNQLFVFYHKFSPMIGKPHGPGGNLEKEFSHSAFPERKRQIRKQTNTIWPKVDSS